MCTASRVGLGYSVASPALGPPPQMNKSQFKRSSCPGSRGNTCCSCRVPSTKWSSICQHLTDNPIVDSIPRPWSRSLGCRYILRGFVINVTFKRLNTVQNEKHISINLCLDKKPNLSPSLVMYFILI